MKYLYNYSYDITKMQLAKLEVESFDKNALIFDNIFFSNKDLDISKSCFIKDKIEILHTTSQIENLEDRYYENSIKDFIIEFVEINKIEHSKKFKNNACKEFGLCFKYDVNFKEPKNILGVTYFNNIFYFGKLTRNTKKYRRFNQKPVSYSNSLDQEIARTSLNIISNFDYNNTFIDPCCGVGTVLLESYDLGFKNVVGSDINYKVHKNAQINVKYYNFDIQVCNADIANIKDNYDICFIDLPYGLFSLTSPEKTKHILENSKRISTKQVIIATIDLQMILQELDFNVINSCEVYKKESGGFKRIIYFCQ